MSSKQKQWFPLESNPIVMTEYADKLGLDVNSYQFIDVLSTEDWALEMIPKPVLAVLLLYPIKESSEAYRHEEYNKIVRDGQILSENVYCMKQIVDNACGTVGILHALINARDYLTFPEDSYLHSFIKKTLSMTPDERAIYLQEDNSIEEIHEDAAQQGQSEQIDIDNVNSHFICFTHVDGYLYELDGRKSFPINHGKTTADSLLEDASKVIQQFMSRDPDEIRFTIITLAAAIDDESS